MKTNPRTLTLGIAGVAALLFAPLTASALVITTFTNQATWQTAAGPTSLENFNDETTGGFTTKAFDGFTATRTSIDITMAVSGGGGGANINGTNYLDFRSDFAPSQEMLWTFDQNFTALGFDWTNTDFSSDKLELRVGSQNFIFGLPTSAGGPGSGFFGIVITDGMAQQVSAISDTAGNGGILANGGFDNVRFNTVPEPATLLLLGLGLGALGFKRRAAA